MDVTIVLEGLLAFSLFVALQPWVFRLTHQDEALRWLMKLYCLVGAMLCTVLYFQNEPPLVISFFIYSGFVGMYIFCIFGVVEGSLTLRILMEISKGGEKGITPRAFLSRYNTKIIVRRRIERFLWSGDLVWKNRKYYRTTKLTTYKLREHVMSIFFKIFSEQ